uniref:Ribosome biogenesis regulatory protein n=1 Tax=Caenorhabditis tropicalis TaxID=1561998 RepID=A0A1I7UFW8_9PELO
MCNTSDVVIMTEDLSEVKIPEYADLPDFNEGKCEDADRDQPMPINKIDFSDVASLMTACPQLDQVKALNLLCEYPVEEAIKQGKKMSVPKRGYVPKQIIKLLGHPLEQDVVRGQRKRKLTEKMSDYVMAKRMKETGKKKFSIMGHEIP